MHQERLLPVYSIYIRQRTGLLQYECSTRVKSTCQCKINFRNNVSFACQVIIDCLMEFSYLFFCYQKNKVFPGEPQRHLISLDGNY